MNWRGRACDGGTMRLWRLIAESLRISAMCSFAGLTFSPASHIQPDGGNQDRAFDDVLHVRLHVLQ